MFACNSCIGSYADPVFAHVFFDFRICRSMGRDEGRCVVFNLQAGGLACIFDCHRTAVEVFCLGG